MSLLLLFKRSTSKFEDRGVCKTGRERLEPADSSRGTQELSVGLFFSPPWLSQAKTKPLSPAVGSAVHQVAPEPLVTRGNGWRTPCRGVTPHTRRHQGIFSSLVACQTLAVHGGTRPGLRLNDEGQTIFSFFFPSPCGCPQRAEMFPSTCQCRSPSSTNSRNRNTLITPFLQVSSDETSLFTPQACACCSGEPALAARSRAL